MKTQIIQLEPHDDVISTRDKMGWGQAPRILLVWPRRGHILTRQLDLTLLRRHCRRMGAQIALVSHDPDVRLHAQAVGIPVFHSVDQAQTTRWRRPRGHKRDWRVRLPEVREAPEDEDKQVAVDARARFEELRRAAHPQPPAWVRQPGVRLGLFALGVLALLAIAAVLVPSAEITLTPDMQTQTLTFTVQAGQAVEGLARAGAVPFTEISVVVEGRDTITTTGRVRLPGDPATGSVLFTNLTDQPVVIPQGTVVRTLGEQPVRFATTRAGEIPAGPGESLGLPIRALTRGAAGNLPPGSIRTVEGDLRLQVTVDNNFATFGGQDFVVAAPDARDRARLYERLFASLQKTALAEIQAQVAPDGLVIAETPTLVEVLEESYDPQSLEPADRLDLLLRLEFKAPAVLAADLQQVVKIVLDADLPPGFAPLDEALTIEHLTRPRLIDGQEARWQVRTRREIIAHLTPHQAINLVLGLPAGEAEARLSSNLDLEGAPRIQLTPAWWPRLPILPFRIQVMQQGPMAPARG